MFLICPNFLWFPAMKDVPAVNWRGLLYPYWFWRVLIALPLRVTYKLLKFSLFEQATAVEFTKIRSQYLAFTLNKISNSWELKVISKLSIWFSASADDRNTFSFVCTSCCTSSQSCFTLAFMSGLYEYLLNLFPYLRCILSKSDKHSQRISCDRVYYFIVWKKYFFFLIDYLDSPFKLCCYTDFLVKYLD